MPGAGRSSRSGTAPRGQSCRASTFRPPLMTSSTPCRASERRSAWRSGSLVKERWPRRGTAPHGPWPTPVLPSSVTQGVLLSSVSCVSTVVCEVLGTGYTASNTPVVFGNQWNGTAWSLVSAATPTASGTPPLIEATGMDCVTTVWCVAVGTTDAGSTTTTPFAEQWNGTSWSLTSVAVPSGVGVTGSYSGLRLVCRQFVLRGGGTDHRHQQPESDRELERHAVGDRDESRHLGHREPGASRQSTASARRRAARSARRRPPRDRLRPPWLSSGTAPRGLS